MSFLKILDSYLNNDQNSLSKITPKLTLKAEEAYNFIFKNYDSVTVQHITVMPFTDMSLKILIVFDKFEFKLIYIKNKTLSYSLKPKELFDKTLDVSELPCHFDNDLNFLAFDCSTYVTYINYPVNMGKIKFEVKRNIYNIVTKKMIFEYAVEPSVGEQYFDIPVNCSMLDDSAFIMLLKKIFKFRFSSMYLNNELYSNLYDFLPHFELDNIDSITHFLNTTYDYHLIDKNLLSSILDVIEMQRL